MEIFLAVNGKVRSSLSWHLIDPRYNVWKGRGAGNNREETEQRLRLALIAGIKFGIIVGQSVMMTPAFKEIAANAGIPVILFTFDPDAIRSTGWRWYPEQIEKVLARNLAQAAA